MRLMGKPDPVIYQACMKMLGLPPHQVLAIGGARGQFAVQIASARSSGGCRGSCLFVSTSAAAVGP